MLIPRVFAPFSTLRSCRSSEGSAHVLLFRVFCPFPDVSSESPLPVHGTPPPAGAWLCWSLVLQICQSQAHGVSAGMRRSLHPDSLSSPSATGSPDPLCLLPDCLVLTAVNCQLHQRGSFGSPQGGFTLSTPSGTAQGGFCWWWCGHNRQPGVAGAIGAPGTAASPCASLLRDLLGSASEREALNTQRPR